MRGLGRAANLLATAIATLLTWIFRLIGCLLTLIIVPFGFSSLWSLVDWSHIGSVASLAGIAGLIFLSIATLVAIGELFDPFDIRTIKPQSGGGKMRSANRDDLRSGGLFGGPR
jgi:hypothetical protein